MKTEQKCLNYPQGYTVEEDLKAIKDKIKEWEQQVDRAISILVTFELTGDWDTDMPSPMVLTEELEYISHEMLSINL